MNDSHARPVSARRGRSRRGPHADATRRIRTVERGAPQLPHAADPRRGFGALNMGPRRSGARRSARDVALGREPGATEVYARMRLPIRARGELWRARIGRAEVRASPGTVRFAARRGAEGRFGTGVSTWVT